MFAIDAVTEFLSIQRDAMTETTLTLMDARLAVLLRPTQPVMQQRQLALNAEMESLSQPLEKPVTMET